MTALVSPSDPQPQSSRRGFLRILAALAPAVGLAGVPARAVTLEEGPAEDPGLLAIGRRAVELEEEYELAHKAEGDARQSFSDLCGPFPEALRIKGEVAALNAESQYLSVLDAAWLRKLAASRSAKSPQGRRVRRKLKIAEAYEARREAAEKGSGLHAAQERLAAVNAEIEALVKDALRHEPRTSAGLLAVAQCFMTAHGPNDPDRQRLWMQAEQPLALAQAVIRLLAPDAADRVLGGALASHARADRMLAEERT